MIRKVFLLFAIAVALIGSAQSDGVWKSHPKYIGSGKQNLIDTGSKVFFLSGNHVFVYDKETKNIGPFDKDNGASDVYATNIYQSNDTQFMVITYDNSNIDIVKNDGSVVNLPDLKDAVYNGNKGINDVTFSNGKIVLAMEFGVVFIDDKTLQITDTYYYNRNITSATFVGNILIVSFENEVLYDPTFYHDNFDKFESTGFMLSNPRFYPVNNERLFIMSDVELDAVDIEFTDTYSFNTSTIARGVVSNIQRTPDGYIAVFPNAGFYYTFDTNGGNPKSVTAAKEFFSCSPNGDGTMWALGDKGLHINGQSDYVSPNGVGITANAFYSAYNPGDGKVYVSRTTDNGVLDKANSQPTAAVTEIWSYDGDLWKNVTPVGAPNNSGNYWLVFEPESKNSYFYSTRTNSIVHVENDTVKHIHNANNSPLTFMNALAFDNDGNLWGVQSFRAINYNSVYNPYVMILPKDKLHAEPAKENWITPNLDGNRATNKRSVIAVSKGSNKVVFTNGDFGRQLDVWDMEGDLYNPSPKSTNFLSMPVDDGTTFSWFNIRCLTPDSVGNVWAGTTSGLFYFDPEKAWDKNFGVHCIKIKSVVNAESDNFLEGEAVQCITIDSKNRKWLGTKNQGVYLLSEDNKSILAQFDATNSALPSNDIYTICIKPNTNSVIFVTSGGIAEYYYEAPDNVENFNNVQTYPNPLLPDYTGLVTISNLVKNSFVKITNRAGDTVAQMQAQGTIIKWDGCDSNGDRLPTGVYNVYAGKETSSMTTTPVAQIRIIK